MANTAATFGFKHIGYLSGGGPDYQQSTRLIQSTYTTKIGFGDPVYKANATSSYIVQGTLALSTAAPLQGIFVGCSFTPSGGLGIPQWSPFWPGAASADATAYIIDAPNAMFLVAANSTAINTANIGNVANFVVASAATTGGGFSGFTLDQATATGSGVTALNLPFKITGMYQGVGNGSDATSAFNWVVVTFNSQTFKVLGS
jgi:hypothetical protein